MSSSTSYLVDTVADRLRGFVSNGDRAALLEHVDGVRPAAQIYEREESINVRRTRRRVKQSDVVAGDMDDQTTKWLYATAVASDAQTIVETGVANGVSTAALLSAASWTGGEVVSIDLPFDGDDIESHREQTYDEFGSAGVPAGEGPGWAIPLPLWDNWTLHEGRSQELLPEVLLDLGGIDMFVHDSEHSQLCMSMELEMAWPRLRPGGIIICDDVSWTGAWEEFVDRRVEDGRHGMLTEDVGYAIK